MDEQNSYWSEAKSWFGIGDQATAVSGCGYVDYNFVDSETRARYVERLMCNAMDPRSVEATASHIQDELDVRCCFCEQLLSY